MTALQPLTDNQVQNRLDAYNAGGALERDSALCGTPPATSSRPRSREQFGDEAAAKRARHYTSPVDAAWIQAVADHGRRHLRREELGSRLYRRAATS